MYQRVAAFHKEGACSKTFKIVWGRELIKYYENKIRTCDFLYNHTCQPVTISMHNSNHVSGDISPL